MLAIAIGLVFTLTFDLQLLGTQGSPLDQLRDANMMKALIVLWAIYAAGVAAQGYWDMEEHTVRAVGFFSLILAFGSGAGLFYFISVVPDFYDTSVTILFSLASLSLTLVSFFLFLYLAVPSLRSLKPVTGWLMLIGSIVVTGVGLIIATTVVVS